MPVNQYKKVEKEIAERILKWFRSVWSALVAFFRLVVQKGKQRFTVMLIPHSEKKIFNFQISLFTLVFVTFLVGVVLAGFFFLATHFTSTNERLAKVSQDLKENESALENFRDEIAAFRRVGKVYKERMEKVVSMLGSESATGYLAAGTGGNLATIGTTDDIVDGTLRELAWLKSLRTLMDNSIEPLSEIYKFMEANKMLLSDTPTYWPLRGVRGVITTLFGPTVHPFSKNLYFHTGLDIAWPNPVPIVATANGEVSMVGISDQLGIYVVIRHKLGFTTKYGHLSAVTAVKGRKVSRGDVIGYLGNTGLSTGPHLHYEVLLGATWIDPLQFLNIRSPMLAPISTSVRNGQ